MSTLVDTATPSTAGRGHEAEVPVVLTTKDTGADRVFKVILAASGTVVLLLLVAMVTFLLLKGWPALRKDGLHFFIGTVWNVGENRFGVLPLLLGSVAIALVAVLIALPVSLAAALMINEYAPIRIRPVLTNFVDVLATIPSIVYGFWGLELVSTLQAGPARWIATYFSFVPFLRTPSPGFYDKSVFATGLVCSLTIIPIITSVSREVMAQAPRETCEAALGLGGTRWGMVTDVLLPFSRNGIVGAALLGFGRGLGETMIPYLMLGSSVIFKGGILGPNGLGSVAGQIANTFTEVGRLPESALILSSLMLFVITLFVSVTARRIVARTGVARR